MDQKQCKGCRYFKPIDGWGGGQRACHHLLLTGHLRRRQGDRCLSYARGRVSAKRSPMGEPSCKSTWSGYQTYGDGVWR